MIFPGTHLPPTNLNRAERAIAGVLRVDEGRAVVSLVLGREVSQHDSRDAQSGATEPIAPELARELLTADTPVESPARDELDQLVDLAVGSRLSAVMISAQRGGGKTTVLTRMAERLGDQALNFEVTVKGLELPMHDPRAFHGLGLAYMNSNRGACHLQHAVQAVEQGMVSWTEAGLGSVRGWAS